MGFYIVARDCWNTESKDIMITQVKRWLHTMFSWWPWRQMPPLEYRHVGGIFSKGTPQEGISLSAVDGTTSQSSMIPRLSTIDERPERIIQAQIPATGDFAETPLPPSLRPLLDISTEPGEAGKHDAASSVPSTPTPQQRLEFLQYLVKRGIVNEGFEEK